MEFSMTINRHSQTHPTTFRNFIRRPLCFDLSREKEHEGEDSSREFLYLLSYQESCGLVGLTDQRAIIMIDRDRLHKTTTATPTPSSPEAKIVATKQLILAFEQTNNRMHQGVGTTTTSTGNNVDDTIAATGKQQEPLLSNESSKPEEQLSLTPTPRRIRKKKIPSSSPASSPLRSKTTDTKSPSIAKTTTIATTASSAPHSTRGSQQQALRLLRTILGDTKTNPEAGEDPSSTLRVDRETVDRALRKHVHVLRTLQTQSKINRSQTLRIYQLEQDLQRQIEIFQTNLDIKNVEIEILQKDRERLALRIQQLTWKIAKQQQQHSKTTSIGDCDRKNSDDTNESKKKDNNNKSSKKATPNNHSPSLMDTKMAPKRSIVITTASDRVLMFDETTTTTTTTPIVCYPDQTINHNDDDDSSSAATPRIMNDWNHFSGSCCYDDENEEEDAIINDPEEEDPGLQQQQQHDGKNTDAELVQQNTSLQTDLKAAKKEIQMLREEKAAAEEDFEEALQEKQARIEQLKKVLFACNERRKYAEQTLKDLGEFNEKHVISMANHKPCPEEHNDERNSYGNKDNLMENVVAREMMVTTYQSNHAMGQCLENKKESEIIIGTKLQDQQKITTIDQLKQEHVAALARITELETQLVHAEKKSEHAEQRCVFLEKTYKTKLEVQNLSLQKSNTMVQTLQKEIAATSSHCDPEKCHPNESHHPQQRSDESESDMEELQRRITDATAKWKEADSKLLFLRNVMLSVVPMSPCDSTSTTTTRTTTMASTGNDHDCTFYESESKTNPRQLDPDRIQ
jgi:hypothetical protein